jgi:hypothetical protein
LTLPTSRLEDQLEKKSDIVAELEKTKTDLERQKDCQTESLRKEDTELLVVYLTEERADIYRYKSSIGQVSFS